MVTSLESARCRVRVAEAMFLEDYEHFILSAVAHDNLFAIIHQ